MADGRDVKLDKIRIISMILVISVHTANYYCRAISLISPCSFFIACLVNSAARVSVPLFFMISGALLLGKDYNSRKNIRRIIMRTASLILFTVIFFFWDKYFMEKENIDLFSLIIRPERKLLWFLYALLGIYIVLPFIKRMVDGMTPREDRLFCILYAIFTGVFTVLKINPEYPVPLVGTTYYLGYFILGHILYKNRKKYDNTRHIAVYGAASLICTAGIAVFAFSICHSTGKYSSSVFPYRSIFIIIAAVCAFIFLYKVLSAKISRISGEISSASFGIYLIHGIFLDFFLKYFPYREINSAAGIPITVFAVFFLTFITAFLLRKIPFLRNLL